MLNIVYERGSEYLDIQLLVYGLKKYIKRSRYYYIYVLVVIFSKRGTKKINRRLKYDIKYNIKVLETKGDLYWTFWSDST